MYVCLYVCMYVYKYTYKSIYIYIYIHIYIDTLCKQSVGATLRRVGLLRPCYIMLHYIGLHRIVLYCIVLSTNKQIYIYIYIDRSIDT